MIWRILLGPVGLIIYVGVWLIIYSLLSLMYVLNKLMQVVRYIHSRVTE